MIDTLKHLSIFSVFDDDELAKLSDICILKKYEKDELLFYEGDQSMYLHLLIKGTIKIYKNTQKGNEIVLAKINPVNFIAEMANFENIPYPASARFMSRSEVLKIDYTQLKQHFFSKPEFVLKLLSSVSRKLIALNELLHAELILSAEAKLAKLLVENLELFNNTKHNKLANLINMAPETFSRILAKFKSEQLIQSDGKKITILDRSSLANLYE